MSSDEDDYMSDSLLRKCDDKRPGLVSKQVARSYKNEIRKKEHNISSRTKSRQMLELEKREEGLKKTLSTENKGFAMLQKMGFKPGMSLGKKGEGRAEPVPIEIKAGRSGLGHESEMQRKRHANTIARGLNLIKRQKFEEKNRTNFRQRKRDTFTEKRVEADLYRSQKVCEQLDSQKGIRKPAELFFWPAEFLKVNQDNEESEDEDVEEEVLFSSQERLEVLTMYLRKEHVYCVWCGTAFTDCDDLTANCPGPTAEAHDD